MDEPTPRQPPAPPTVVYVQPLTPVRAMALTVAVLFVLGLVWLLVQIRSIVLLLIVGILLATAIEPLVNRMRRRGLSRGQAIVAIYAAILAVVALALYLVIPPLYAQGRDLITSIPEYLDQFRREAAASPNEFIRTSGTQTVDRIIEIYHNPGAGLRFQATQVSQAINIVTSVIGVLFTTVSVMIVAFYWLTEKAIIKRLALGLFPMDRRDRAHGLWDEIEHKLGGWARGEVLLMLIIGAASTIAYSPLAFDLPFWFLLGIWAGFTELIPFIGPFLGGALAAAVALTDSWQKAVLVVLFVVVLQQVEGSVIVPRVMRDAVGLTPLSVILAILIGGALLGPLGALLAIPVGAAVQVVVSDLLRAREVAVDADGGLSARLLRRAPAGPSAGAGGGAEAPNQPAPAGPAAASRPAGGVAPSADP